MQKVKSSYSWFGDVIYSYDKKNKTWTCSLVKNENYDNEGEILVLNGNFSLESKGKTKKEARENLLYYLNLFFS